MARLKLGIIFGGSGEENPVSVKSAQEVARNIDLDKYEPFYIGISPDGVWRLCDGPDAGWRHESSRPAVLSTDRGEPGLLVLDHGKYEVIPLDLVFPVLHGSLGEDGTMQGLLELSGIPYVGCDVQSSALCMDKSLTYLVARNAGITTPKFWTITAKTQLDPERFPYPVVVKPARSGSSFGVTKVTNEAELVDAVETARKFDSKVLIEEAIVGSEIGCSILGERYGLVVGEVDQIRVSEGIFRIHQEDKPESGSENATIVVPADISEESRRLVQETAKTLYLALGCRSLARVDVFLKDDGSVVLNEVQTLPGMTSYSRYPRMMAAAGIGMADLIDRMLSMSLHGNRR